MQKLSYQFAGHTDRYRRFDCFAEHVGNTQGGRAVYAWRDGLWTLAEHSGASTFYVATRVSVNDIARPHDTKASREALAALISARPNRV